MVYLCIITSFTQTILMGVMKEGQVEAWVFKEDPNAADQAAFAMDVLFRPGNERYMQLVQDSIGQTEQLNVNFEASRLRSFLGGGEFQFAFYQIPETSWLRNMYDVLGNIFGGARSTEVIFYMDKSEQATTSMFNNWATRIALDPSGYQALAEADTIPTIIMTLVFIVILTYIAYRIFRWVRR